MDKSKHTNATYDAYCRAGEMSRLAFGRGLDSKSSWAAELERAERAYKVAAFYHYGRPLTLAPNSE